MTDICVCIHASEQAVLCVRVCTRVCVLYTQKGWRWRMTSGEDIICDSSNAYQDQRFIPIRSNLRNCWAWSPTEPWTKWMFFGWNLLTRKEISLCNDLDYDNRGYHLELPPKERADTEKGRRKSKQGCTSVPKWGREAFPSRALLGAMEHAQDGPGCPRMDAPQPGHASGCPRMDVHPPGYARPL